MVDQWIVDLKDMDSSIYKQYTKAHLSHIRQSLECLRLLGLKDKTKIKVPIIPNYNSCNHVDENVEELQNLGFNDVEVIQYIKRPSKYHK